MIVQSFHTDVSNLYLFIYALVYYTTITLNYYYLVNILYFVL